MEIFRKGSDPPLIFGSYGAREAELNFGVAMVLFIL